jgi:hypothetical protein
VSKEGKEIKITDKRMFTPDGELREEYRFLEEKSTAAPGPAAAPGSPAGDASAAPPAAPSRSGVAAGAAARPDEAAAAPSGSDPRAASGRSSRRAAAARDEPPSRASGGPGGAAAGSAGAGLGEARGSAGGEAWSPDEPSARLEFPSSAPGLGPSFYDLAALLAEPVALYLGDMELPDGQSAENLEMARLYIDLLDVLRQKTAGNLTAQEAAFLEDLLYRLRVRYVQKRG